MSGYNFDGEHDRSQGTVIFLTPQAGSRYPHYKSVMGAGTKAKSVTNNLPILSVLVESAVNVSLKTLFSRRF